MSQIANWSNNLRIGYVPVSPDLRHPTDRRLFCYYAKKRGIGFEIAEDGCTYDMVIVSARADLTMWQKTTRTTKLVFILEDSYLAIPGADIKNKLRGLGKFMTRQHRYLQLDYRLTLEKMCHRANAVLCPSPEQRQQILRLCPNVHVTPAFQTEAIRRVKQSYSSGDVFNFVWEGMGGNVRTFRVIRDALDELRKKHRFSCHLITDVEYPLALGDLGRVPTKKLVRKAFGSNPAYLYEWNEEILSVIATACDLALIPIPLDIPLYAGKPENKLLLFWRMGIPAVTSETPAFRRVMEASGLAMACRSTDDWIRVLDNYMSNEEARRDAGQRGRAYAEEHYGEEALVKRWDDVFASVLFGV